MNKKRVEEDLVAIAFSIFFMFFMYFFISPSLTGFVIYDPSYTYNVSEVNYSNGTLSIKAIENVSVITTTFVKELSLTSASLTEQGDNDSDDILSRVNSLDNQSKNIDKNDVFNVSFNESLNSGDKVNFKVDDITGSNVTVYLCSPSTNCSYPGYGAVNVSGAGFYSIIIAGLNGSVNSFNIDPPLKVNFNHVNATKIVTITNSTTSYYYPTYPIEIVTEDMQPANLSSFDSFLRNDSLNGQNISYYYSIDSGANWSDMPSDNNLAGVNSTKIKIRAVMQSNGSGTPYIYSLSVNYSVVAPQNYTGNQSSNSTNQTQSNSTNSTENNSTASNSTAGNSTESGSGGTSGSSPASTNSPSRGGLSSRERAARAASAPSAAVSSPSVASAPAASAPAPSGRAAGPPTGQAIKVEESNAKENKIVANVITYSIIALVLITLYVARRIYLNRKALKVKIK